MNHPAFIVTGSSGWIGRSVCSRLKAAGYFIISADLKQSAGPWDVSLTMDISWDDGFPDFGALNQWSDNFDGLILVHCAGYAHRAESDEGETARFFAINAAGSRRVVDWAKAVGVSRIVYLSSIAFYDWRGVDPAALPLKEDAPLFAYSAYAKSKLEGEVAMIQSELDYRILRLSTVFGDGDRANFSKLAKSIKAGRFVIPGDGSARKSVISIQSAASWISQIALRDDVSHRVMNLGFCHAPTLRQICNAYSELYGVKMPKSVPVSILKGSALAGDLLRHFNLQFKFNTDTLRKLVTPTWVDCGRAGALFPESGMLTFESALAECADYYRGI